MRKLRLLTILSLIFIIVACKSSGDVEEERIQRGSGESFVEQKGKIESKKSEEKTEEESTDKNPKPNERPEEVAEDLLTTETFVIKGPEETEEEESEEISDNLLGSDVMELRYYGREYFDLEAENYQLSSVILDEGGESMVFIPKVAGGTFNVISVEYNPEENNYILGHNIFSKILGQSDAVVIKTLVPEGSPNVMVEYENPGSYKAQMVIAYDGMTDIVQAQKGFELIDSR